MLAISFLISLRNACAEAGQYSAPVNAELLQSFMLSAQTFRQTGWGPFVQITLPTNSGTAVFKVEPHDLRAPHYAAEITGSYGRIPDT
ncbi:MAG TPA: hypothetical protein PLP17_13050, partial [Oligoflexia bacterium]|nr:hypothetical protein [Oligoflexia bacterium]